MVISENLDPAELPDAETGFSDTVLGITWHGSAKLYNGKFWGLSSIARTGDTSFTVDGTSARLTAYADVSDIQIYLDATMDLVALDGLKLQEFHISHVGHIDVDISGLGPLDWILEIVADFIDAFLKDWIVDLVEGPLKDLIQSILDDLI